MKHLLALWLSAFTFVANAQPDVIFQSYATGFTQPVDIVSAGDSRLFIVQKGGLIRIVQNGTVFTTPFLNVSTLVSTTGEQGLLSLAFHPRYDTNRYFFIYYTNTSGAITLARYRTNATNPNVADPLSGVILLTIPKTATNHNGGKLNFGSDGYLYFGTGDGGGAGDPNNNAQSGNSLLGKMLRLDVDNFTTAPYYSIPATNPYVGVAAVRDEIIALGLRNPWRWSFDRQTGDMWIADVGQNAWEEVNYRSASNIMGVNYGWKCYEGNAVYSSCTTPVNNVFPIFQYAHNNTTGGFSITGGYVYRGTEYPSLQGYYLCADYVSGNGWLIKANGTGGWQTTIKTTWPDNLTAFGEDSAGRMYAASLTAGVIYKVTTNETLPLKLNYFTLNSSGAYNILSWQALQVQQGDVLILQQAIAEPVAFEDVHTQTVASAASHITSQKQLPKKPVNTYYRLKLKANSGEVFYSNVLSAKDGKDETLTVWRSGDRTYLKTAKQLRTIAVYDMAGRLIKSESFTAASGIVSIVVDGRPFQVLKATFRDGTSESIKLPVVY